MESQRPAVFLGRLGCDHGARHLRAIVGRYERHMLGTMRIERSDGTRTEVGALLALLYSNNEATNVTRASLLVTESLFWCHQ